MKSVLSSIFIYAIDRKYLDKNPTEKVKIKAENNQIERFLTDDEREQLLTACKGSTWDKMHLLILLAITTGMRKSELSNLIYAGMTLILIRGWQLYTTLKTAALELTQYHAL